MTLLSIAEAKYNASKAQFQGIADTTPTEEILEIPDVIPISTNPRQLFQIEAETKFGKGSYCVQAKMFIPDCLGKDAVSILAECSQFIFPNWNQIKQTLRQNTKVVCQRKIGKYVYLYFTPINN